MVSTLTPSLSVADHGENSPINKPASAKSNAKQRLENGLKLSIAAYTDKGRKTVNQDFHACRIPEPAQLTMKGAVIAMADGISSSQVSQIASETAVKTFLEDYYCTSEAWTVKTAVEKVLAAINSWLFAQSQQGAGRYDKDQGYVCTFSALVFKHRTAHVFHAGDTRVYRLTEQGLEQVTHDHRLWVNQQDNYLSRALGMQTHCDFEYRALPLNCGDIYLICTDGVYESLDSEQIIQVLKAHRDDLDSATKILVGLAYQAGSQDNLSIQLVHIDALPEEVEAQLKQDAAQLPLPPALNARMTLDNYEILRPLHSSNRSHVYLAREIHSNKQLVLKTPSLELSLDANLLEGFLKEEWVARRVNSAHVLKADLAKVERSHLYTVFDYVEGQTLAQWAQDNPKPSLEKVRGLIEQIAKGLNALHRMEMLHQDIRPENIMITLDGTVKIIDFGTVFVAGLAESNPKYESNNLQGTALYSAPEYFIGDAGSVKSELFSLGVITYFLLSGRYPYHTQVAKTKNLASQRNLRYHSVLDEDSDIPIWVDDAIRKAVHPLPEKRHQGLFEFVHNLRAPSQSFLSKTRPPLIERNPVAVWQGICALLSLIIVYLLMR